MANIEDIEKTIYLFEQRKEEITEQLYEVILNYYEEILKDTEEWLEKLKEEKRLEEEKRLQEEQEEEITDGDTHNAL